MWNNPFYVIAFILGIIVIILSSLTFALPKAKSHLVVKLLFDITYITQMIMIYLFSGSYLVLAAIASNSVGAIRDIAYIKVENDKARFFWTIGLTMMMVACVQFTYSNPASYLPIVGTLINTVALSFKNKRYASGITIIGQFAFISYYLILLKDSDLLTILNTIGAVMLLLSATFGFSHTFKKHK